MARKQRHSYKRRHERQNDIILSALGQYQGGRREFTTAKMAKWLGYSVSTRLKRMIDDLVSEGWFVRHERIHRNTMGKDGNRFVIMKHVYSLSDVAMERLSIL